MQAKSNPPAFVAGVVVWLPKGHQQPRETVRVHNSRIDASKKNPRKFRRHQSVVLVNTENDAKVVLGVIGTPDDVTIPRNGIGLNYEAINALRLHDKEVVEVMVRPASVFDVYGSLMRHPDPVVRISLWFGLFGTVTGVISLIGMLF